MGAPDTYTHGHHPSVLRSHEWRTVENSCGYLIPHLAPGTDVLDIGCGPGTITADLARRVAPGVTFGTDVAADIVVHAAAHHPAADVRWQTADVYALPFADASVDIAHAHQVLQHLSRPVEALREMRRVVRPGGLVAARDSIYGCFSWAPDLPELREWLDLYMAVTRHNGADADAGRHLKSWAHAAGLRDVTYTSSTWTFATEAECQWWGELWADRATQSQFARQAVDYGLADTTRLNRIRDGWRRWADHPDAVLVILHGEVVGRR